MTINKFLMNKSVKSNTEKITILQMVQWVDEWQEQEQLNIPVVVGRSEQLICWNCETKYPEERIIKRQCPNCNEVS